MNLDDFTKKRRFKVIFIYLSTYTFLIFLFALIYSKDTFVDVYCQLSLKLLLISIIGIILFLLPIPIMYILLFPIKYIIKYIFKIKYQYDIINNIIDYYKFIRFPLLITTYLGFIIFMLMIYNSIILIVGYEIRKIIYSDDNAHYILFSLIILLVSFIIIWKATKFILIKYKIACKKNELENIINNCKLAQCANEEQIEKTSYYWEELINNLLIFNSYLEYLDNVHIVKYKFSKLNKFAYKRYKYKYSRRVFEYIEEIINNPFIVVIIEPEYSHAILKIYSYTENIFLGEEYLEYDLIYPQYNINSNYDLFFKFDFKGHRENKKMEYFYNYIYEYVRNLPREDSRIFKNIVNNKPKEEKQFKIFHKNEIYNLAKYNNIILKDDNALNIINYFKMKMKNTYDKFPRDTRKIYNKVFQHASSYNVKYVDKQFELVKNLASTNDDGGNIYINKDYKTNWNKTVFFELVAYEISEGEFKKRVKVDKNLESDINNILVEIRKLWNYGNISDNQKGHIVHWGGQALIADRIWEAINNPNAFIARLFEGDGFRKVIAFEQNNNKSLYQKVVWWTKKVSGHLVGKDVTLTDKLISRIFNGNSNINFYDSDGKLNCSI